MLTSALFSIIFGPSLVLGKTECGDELPSPDQSSRPLADHLVVFTGKLSSLGPKEARALVLRLGGITSDEVNAKTTMLVVGDDGSGPTADTSRKLRKAEELNALGSTVEILTEDQFCRRAGVPTPDVLKSHYYAMRDLLARYRLLREDHIRYLVKCNIIMPVLRTNADTFFAFPDVAVIKQANDTMSQGLSFQSAVRTLLAAKQGQLTFDFRLDAAPAKILALHEQPTSPTRRETVKPSSDTALAEQYFLTGSALDNGDESTREQAASAYRRALELDPCLVAALINLANIHYSRDELVEAQALYERAISLESDFFEAHFNLGNIYHDLGRFSEAQRCYEEALRLNPYYPDTRFYLAVTLEKMGLSQEARPHWRAYQQLAPQGEWVELAKEFSE
jgi:tetratricopeptide (TPR) repeat protein